MISEKQTTGEKIAGLAVKGFKKAMSSTVGEEVYVVRRIKARSYDLYANLRDFSSIVLSAILIVFYSFIGLFRILKDMPSEFKMAAKNNFRLGLMNLKANNLIDARIRFLLSNMFYGKSATTKYYIAYVYYLQGNYTKSLKYLRQSTDIDNSDERSKVLLLKLEESLADDSYKIDVKKTASKKDNNKNTIE